MSMKDRSEQLAAAERDVTGAMQRCYDLLCEYSEARGREKMSANRVQGVVREMAELIKVIRSCTGQAAQL